MRGWISDLGFALRVMARKPQASLMLVATFVLGISVTTAMFSVLDAVLLRPLPFVDPNRVVVLGGAGINEFEYWNGSHTFEHLARYFSGGANLVVQGRAHRTQVTEVSTDFFAVFSVQPIVGNVFDENDSLPGRNHVAILSHGFWQQNFDSSPAALGTTIRINGEEYVVTGIMPSGFSVPGNTALWVPRPRGSASLDLISGEQIDLPFFMNQRLVGRLRQGVPLDQARRELEDLRLALKKKLAGTRYAVTSQVSVGPYQQRLVSNFRPGLMLLFLAAAMILMIACVNAGGLLFARGAIRRKEIGVRMSLGASRWRIVRQLLAEGSAIAVVSGIAAVALSGILIRAVRVFGPAEMPRLSEANLNLRALVFALAVSQFTGLLAGLWPALRCSSVRILSALQSAGPKSGGQFSTRSRRVLIVAEIAAAMALTCTAGIALRSLHNLMSVDVGFAREHVLTMRLAPPMPHPARSANATPVDAAAAQKALFAKVMATRQLMLDTVRSIPGVNFAAETDKLPLDRTPNGYTFLDIGTKLAAAELHTNEVDGDYFAALGIPQLVGRTFDALDDASSPKVCVVNIKLASYFGGVTESLGKQVKPEGWDAPRQIVGVVANSLTSSLDSEVDPELYVPVSQNISGRPSTEVALILRVAGDPRVISTEVTRRLQHAFTDAPPFQVQMLDRVISDSVAQPRFRGELLGGFAALGMALALAGIYGVIAFSVAARTHEIGIRLALGAERSRILRMVLAEGLRLGIAGIVLGIGVAWSLKQYLATLVFGVKALDPVTIAAAALMLLGVALLACAVPARRASRVDPVIALRYE